jgi:hypothetical protein
LMARRWRKIYEKSWLNMPWIEGLVKGMRSLNCLRTRIKAQQTMDH